MYDVLTNCKKNVTNHKKTNLVFVKQKKISNYDNTENSLKSYKMKRKMLVQTGNMKYIIFIQISHKTIFVGSDWSTKLKNRQGFFFENLSKTGSQ